MAQDYNKTLNLPTTEFNMRGALPQREPGWVKDWQDKQLYHKMIKNNEGKPLYILHDGPPYANGDIHLGTALNKVLKDFIIRQKNMSRLSGRRTFPAGTPTVCRSSSRPERKRASQATSARSSCAKSARNLPCTIWISSAASSCAWAFWASGKIRT